MKRRRLLLAATAMLSIAMAFAPQASAQDGSAEAGRRVRDLLEEGGLPDDELLPDFGGSAAEPAAVEPGSTPRRSADVDVELDHLNARIERYVALAGRAGRDPIWFADWTIEGLDMRRPENQAIGVAMGAAEQLRNLAQIYHEGWTRSDRWAGRRASTSLAYAREERRLIRYVIESGDRADLTHLARLRLPPRPPAAARSRSRAASFLPASARPTRPTANLLISFFENARMREGEVIFVEAIDGASRLGVFLGEVDEDGGVYIVLRASDGELLRLEHRAIRHVTVAAAPAGRAVAARRRDLVLASARWRESPLACRAFGR